MQASPISGFSRTDSTGLHRLLDNPSHASAMLQDPVGPRRPRHKRTSRRCPRDNAPAATPCSIVLTASGTKSLTEKLELEGTAKDG
jgi:hypothetical protein